MIIDASVAIAVLNGDDAHHDRAVHILLDTAGQPLVVPALTAAETLVAHVRAGTEEIALQHLQSLGMTVDEGVASPVELARVRVETGLKLPDCIVLHAAEKRAEPMATFDARLADVGRSRGGVVYAFDD